MRNYWEYLAKYGYAIISNIFFSKIYKDDDEDVSGVFKIVLVDLNKNNGKLWNFVF